VSDPRAALRAGFARWLRVRIKVRALAAKVRAAQHALERDARRSDDPDMLTLAAQLGSEHEALAAVASDLDERLRQVKDTYAALGYGYVGALAATARSWVGKHLVQPRTVNGVESDRPSGPPMIAYADFAKLDIRAGTIVAAAPLANARKPAFVLDIDFGPELGVKRSSAQITVHYRPETLVGRQVAAVVNFAAKRIAGVRSEVLVLGFADAGGAVVVVEPTIDVPNGARLS
jgi:tRNA-binding protein